jgi:hypothetical protein
LPQKPKSHLETVSTVRGSGWVAVPKCEIAIDYKHDRFTHPLPRTVLTVSKRDVLDLKQSRAGGRALPQGPKSFLDRVSTGSDSDLVGDQYAIQVRSYF